MTNYRKLVRDKIPEQLEQAGKTIEVETLNHDRYIMELRKKLQEEMMEYENAANPEEALDELADVSEVMHQLARVHGATMDDIEALRVKREEEYGGFDEKQFLIQVDEE